MSAPENSIVERLTKALEWALERCSDSDHPHYPEKNHLGMWSYPYLINGSPMGGGVGEASFDTALEAVESAIVERRAP